MTDRSHGDLAIDSHGVEARRQQIVDAPWSWLRQVHSNQVVEVMAKGLAAGVQGDALWTSVPGAALAVQVADCAPVALIAASGQVGAIHVGWRGLLAGVLPACAAEMRGNGALDLVAVLGACIHVQNYEFGVSDLAAVEAKVGARACGMTSDGAPALDLPGAVESVLDELAIPLVASLGGCTAGDATTRWSHRARGDTERQALVVWMDGS